MRGAEGAVAAPEGTGDINLSVRDSLNIGGFQAFWILPLITSSPTGSPKAESMKPCGSELSQGRSSECWPDLTSWRQSRGTDGGREEALQRLLFDAQVWWCDQCPFQLRDYL